MEYDELVAVYDRLGATQSTTEKTDIVAESCSAASVEDLPMLVQLLRGAVFAAWQSDDLGVSSNLAGRAIARASGLPEAEIEEHWRETGDLGDAASRAVEDRVQQTLVTDPVTVERVYGTLQSLADLEGEGSEQRRVDEIAGLLADADPEEARYIVRTALGKLRLGVGEGTIRDAIARAFLDDSDADAVERALQVTNDAGVVAQTAATDGRAGIDDLELSVHRPVKVMLAEKADSVAAAVADATDLFDGTGAIPDAESSLEDDGAGGAGGASEAPVDGEALVEYKVDGFRAQVHATPEECRVFTRRLEDVTTQFPEVAAAAREGFDADSFVLEGEVLGYDPETEEPVPFQQLSRRIKRKHGIDRLVEEVPVVLFAFDLLAVDGEELLDETMADRVAELECRLSDEPMAFERMPSLRTGDVDAAEAFYEDALAAGHEGVMVKDPSATYQPGKRVGYTLKVKPTMEPLDLTVTRARWSEGRRSDNLGRLFLACRDADTGEFREIGRLSTGFSDEQLAELTERLEASVLARDGREVRLEPSEVLEVGYEEIQTSPEYDSGYALRFPRFEGFRDDVALDEVDSLARVERLFQEQ